MLSRAVITIDRMLNPLSSNNPIKGMRTEKRATHAITRRQSTHISLKITAQMNNQVRVYGMAYMQNIAH